MAYTLRPTSEFVADIRSLDMSIRALVEKKLERIRLNPLLSKPLRHAPNCYSERVKNYRIIFRVLGNEILLYRIGKRENVYDN